MGRLILKYSHRIMCGDSTNVEDVAQLMNGSTVDMVFTSPPYGMGKNISLRGQGKSSCYDVHDDDPKDWFDMMCGWFDASEDFVSNIWVVNLQMLSGNKNKLIEFVFRNIERLIDIMVWDKGHGTPAMAERVLNLAHEFIFCFNKKTANRAFPLASWRGVINSVYSAPKQTNNEYASIHAATMPVHLPIFALGTLCDLSKTVYEPFCGTGTTLIAAEQLNKRCYAMEISPQYVDVSVIGKTLGRIHRQGSSKGKRRH